MKTLFLSIAFLSTIILSAHAQTRFITKTGQATIFSHTSAEDITASNNTVTGIIDPSTGEVAIAVPVQSFQFEKALMQEHFNSPNFMDSKQFPRISLKGKINNLSAVNFNKDGKYNVEVTAELTIKGSTKPVTENAVIEINNGKVIVNSKFMVKAIGAYGVGKPKGSKKNNVADDILVTYVGSYEKGDE